MKIREVKLDPDTVAKLNWLDSMTFFGEKNYPKPGSYWWIVYGDDGQAVGFAGLQPYTDEIAFLCRAGVLKPYRFNGIHKRLIQVREAKARKLGFKYLVTYTSHSNVNSANNLVKRGYKLYEPAKRYGFADSYYLRKEL